MRKHTILHILILLVFLKPTFIGEIPSLHFFDNLFNILQVLLFIIFVLFIFVNRLKLSKITIAMIIYLISTLFQTVIYSGDLWAFSTYFVQIMGIVLLLEIAIFRGTTMQMQKSLAVLLVFLLISNFVSIILYPLGWYDTGRWILGTGNNMLTFILPALAFANIFLIKSITQKIMAIIINLVGFFSVLLVESSTSIIVVTLFLLFMLLINVYKKIHLKLWAFIFFSVFLGIGLVFFHIQDYFSVIIIDILHKDLTLSLRNIVWENAIHFISMRPLFGYGVESAALTISKITGMHMHNIWLNTLYFGGMFSLVCFINYILKVVKIVDNKISSREKNIFILTIGLFFIAMQTEVYLRIPLLFFILNLVYFEYRRYFKKIRIRE